MVLALKHSLVTEVAHPGEDHGNARFVGSINHFLVAHGTTRLNNGGNARSGGGINAITEGEEGIRRHNGTRYRKVFVGRFDARNFSGVHATHLACAHANGLARLWHTQWHWI